MRTSLILFLLGFITLVQGQDCQELLREANEYAQKGNFKEAALKATEAYSACKSEFGEENSFTIKALNLIGAFQIELGQYDTAYENLQKALELAKKSLGEKHPDYAAILNSLVQWHSVTNSNLEEGISLAKKALEITKATVGEENLQYGSSLNNLAMLYMAQGKYNESLSLLTKLTEITKKNIRRGTL